MTYRDYVALMSVATIAAWISWVVVLSSIDPAQSGVLGFVLFYATLGLSVLGTFSLVGAGVRIWLKKEEIVSRHVTRSLRQSFLLSSLLIGSLCLLSFGFFRWWTVGMFILTLACMEMAFVASSRSR